jgi:NADPH:quinone reductase-like Zn-dependent oxidoreductase
LGLGADLVIDHGKPLPAQLAELKHKEVDYVANFANTDQYWAAMAEVVKPEGHIVSIVENSGPIEIGLLKSKSASFHWTFMFTRSMFRTPDMEKQGVLLNKVAELIDAGKIRATHNETLRPISATNLRSVHAKLESGRAIGKITLAGW